MTKRKRIAISLLAALFVAVIILTVGVFFYMRSDESGRSFSVKDTLPDGEGKKATVILLGGQSNASGASLDEYLKKNVTAEKYAEYERGFDNVYINYLSGLKESGEFVKCGVRQGELDGGFGPELGIAEKLNELYPDRTFFIIKCAWGGSNLFRQWLSPKSFGKTGEMYRDFAAFVNTSIEYLAEKNYDVKVEAMCWMQGESDSFSEENAADYEKNLTNLIEDIRKKFDAYASDDGIAFVDAYIADNPAYWVHYAAVNEAKRRVADSSDINTVIDTVSLGLSCSDEPADSPDLAHYDSLSQLKLGNLFAEEASAFFDR